MFYELNAQQAINLEQTTQTFEWCRKYGISTRAYILLGAPGETHDTIKETRTFLHTLKADTVGFSVLSPFPGTLESYLPVVHDEGHPDNCQFCTFFPCEPGTTYLDAIDDWEGTDEYGSEFWRTEGLTNLEIRSYQRAFIEEFAETSSISAHARRQLISDDYYSAPER